MVSAIPKQNDEWQAELTRSTVETLPPFLACCTCGSQHVSHSVCCRVHACPTSRFQRYKLNLGMQPNSLKLSLYNTMQDVVLLEQKPWVSLLRCSAESTENGVRGLSLPQLAFHSMAISAATFPFMAEPSRASNCSNLTAYKARPCQTQPFSGKLGCPSGARPFEGWKWLYFAESNGKNQNHNASTLLFIWSIQTRGN